MEVRPGWSWGRAIYSLYFLGFAFVLPDNMGAVKLTVVFFLGSIVFIDVFLRNRISISREGVRKGIVSYTPDSVAGFLIKKISVDANFLANAPALMLRLRSGDEISLLSDPVFLDEADLEQVKAVAEKFIGE
jgi:hypothetical protein